MADDATILAQFGSRGEDKLLTILQDLMRSMQITEINAKNLSSVMDALSKAYESGAIKTKEFYDMQTRIQTLIPEINSAEKERVKALKDLEKANEAEIVSESKRNAEMAKTIAKIQELNSTSLGRFTSQLYGGQKGLDQFQASAYSASRNANLMAQSLATRPIATFKEFAKSSEKAAIAAQFLREQIAFVAASRFGTIMAGFAIFGTISAMIKGAVGAMMELEKQVKLVESAFTSGEKTLNTYNEIQKQIIVSSIQFGQSYQDIANILWELKSAGLSAGESMAGLQVNQQLVIAGAANLNEATRITAGLFQNFGDNIEAATSDFEKFRRIGDVIATVVYESQGTMQDLVGAIKYVAASAELAGVPLDVLGASIAVLNNKMLFGTKAGTSLNNAFLQLSKNYDKIVKQFSIAIDPSKTIGDQFLSIISQMQAKFKDSGMTLEEMSALFDGLNIRGGRAMAALILSGDEFWNILGKTKGALEGNSNALQEIVDTRMDTTVAQWERFKKAVSAVFVEWNQASPAKWLLKGVADATELYSRLEQITDAVGILGAIKVEPFKQELARITDDIDVALNLVRKYPKELSIIYRADGLIDTIDNTEELVTLIQQIQKAPVDINVGKLLSNLLKLKMSVEESMKLINKYPTELKVIFNTPGLKDSIKDSQELYDLLNQMDGRTVSFFFSSDEQEKMKKNFDDIYTKMNSISGISQVQKQTFREIVMASEDYNLQEQLGFITKKQHLALVTEQLEAEKERLVTLSAGDVAYNNSLDKIKKLVQEQKSLQESSGKTAKTAQTMGDIFREIAELEMTGSTKTLTSDLQAAIEKANKLKVGTKEWNSAVKEVASAYKESLTAQDGLNKQIAKAISSFDKLKSAGAGFVEVLKKAGQVGLAEQVAQFMARQAEQSLLLARTDEQRLTALQNIINAQKILEDNNWGSYDALQRQIGAYSSMFNITNQMLSQDTQRIAKANELRSQAQGLFEQTKQWKQPTEQFNTALDQSQQNMQQIYVWSGNVLKNMQVMGDQGGVNFQGSVQQAKDLNQNLTQTSNILGNVNNSVGQVNMTMGMTNSIMQQFANNSESLPIVWRGTQQMMQSMAGQVLQIDAATGRLVTTTSELPIIWRGFSEKINAPIQMLNNSIISFDDATMTIDENFNDVVATVYTLTNGMLKTVKAGEENAQSVEEWNTSFEDVDDSMAQVVTNYAKSATKAQDLTNVTRQYGTETDGISSSTQDIAVNLTKWESPLRSSFGTTESLNSAMGDVNNSVEQVLSNLDRMAQKIRSMPKLNVTGGGGGMPTNNDILTNPGYQ